ncbi:MAG: MopE-related protein [Desulfobulbaceae bacterium]|nr:MopE-related protein [Desulfobulbaceae bacterium]
MVKKKVFISFTLLLFILATGITAQGARPDHAGGGKPPKKVVDYDNDGYNSNRDCNDNDPAVYPGAEEICGDGIDQDCDGFDAQCETVCTDNDGDGFAVEGGDCGPVDCNDADDSAYPGAVEICGDNIDQNCDGADLPCTGEGPHAGLTFDSYPQNCLGCHDAEANDMYGSVHYQWTGEAPDMVNSPEVPQGKLFNAVNSYCINIEENWPVCGSCHTGRGKRPDDPSAGLENIDCLACHSEEYAAARKRLPDGSLGVDNPTDFMVQNVQKPTRLNCLMCHAKAGGGDAVKRGDLSLQTIDNSDASFDVHMNTSGSDLSCQQCHVFEAHRVLGKGSDLRPTDDLVRGAEIECITCHAGKDSQEGHADSDIGKHTERVACQTCHIPTYAKVATETHRDWRLHSDGSPADGVSGPGHPYSVKDSNLIPEYRFWNRLSDNYLLGDDASLTYDAARNTYPTSRPLGDVEEGKLYPFKYKTATQPKTIADDRLIALDTFEYMKGSGDAAAAVEKGLENMGYSAAEPYEWVETDTYQLLNHGVNPSAQALQCSSCHGSTERIDLQGELGYDLKGDTRTVCTQCHGLKEQKPFTSLHDRHVNDKGYDCSWCHGFSRPERGLRIP